MLNTKDFPPLPSRGKFTDRSPKPHSPRKQEAPSPPLVATEANLASLPTELLLQILSYLPLSRPSLPHLPTLTALSLTNRRLHTLVTPTLYSTYDSNLCTPYPFLRTLMSTPSLASHVKTIAFGYGYRANEVRPRYAASIADKHIIKDALKKLSIPGLDWKKWASDCNDVHGQLERLYATILLYSPHVQSLEVQDGPLYDEDEDEIMEGRSPWWLVYLRQIAGGAVFGGVHGFEHLGSICVDAVFMKLRFFAPVFGLRSLRKVTLRNLREEAYTRRENVKEFRRFAARPSAVEEVCFEGCFVDDGVIEAVVGCVARLRVFRYGISDEQMHFGDEAVNCYHSVIKALERHSASLETLHWSDDPDAERPPRATHPCDLSSFTNLTDIEVPIALLALRPKDKPIPAERLATNLPSSVKQLNLHLLPFGIEVYDACLDYLAAHVSECAPSLQVFRIAVYSTLTMVVYYWKDFEKSLRERGVEFECKKGRIENLDDDWGTYGGGGGSFGDPEESSDDGSSDEESLYSF